jgi:putative transposase
MGVRSLVFTEGEYYHVYNRGVDHREIVGDEYDSNRFVQCLDMFNDTELSGSIYALSFDPKRIRGKKLVDLIAYCLNPNHFHLVLQQRTKDGISKFMHRLSGGYAWYFNSKYKRTGSLWEGRFKAKHISENNYLLHVSAYVNLNNRVHQLSGRAAKFVRSSWTEYSEGVPGICEKDFLIEQFV